MTTRTNDPTHLRDARLRKALEHAPDAQAAAPAAVRAAILRQARQATAPTAAAPAAAPPAPWWKRLPASLLGTRRPWNAALASVLLAGVVVGLWWDREVPGPRPDAHTRDLPMAAPPPAAEAPAPPLTPPAPAPSSVAVPAASPAPVPPEAREPSRPVPRPPSPAPARRAPSELALPQAMPPQPPPAAPQERSRKEESASVAQDQMTADAAPPSAATAPRATGPAPSRELRSSRMAPAAAPTDGWAALQVLPATGPARPRSGLPAEITQAIAAMLDTGPTGVPADDPVLLQIVLLQGNGLPLGRLELGSRSLRWTPAGTAGPRAFSAGVEPALSLRVREGLAPR
ncbi:hypothetical protein [Pseudorhodoferax sp. Leaf267]|uniref:hypothetical protein n=1 Tax=Pseudorhodoferax sp. Leaf267 TaxID=1736316 RepID=UPI0012E24F49|nr:hypothetical protein [Pseudorhodoferax sp. Leaf267]